MMEVDDARQRFFERMRGAPCAMDRDCVWLGDRSGPGHFFTYDPQRPDVLELTVADLANIARDISAIYGSPVVWSGRCEGFAFDTNEPGVDWRDISTIKIGTRGRGQRDSGFNCEGWIWHADFAEPNDGRMVMVSMAAPRFYTFVARAGGWGGMNERLLRAVRMVLPRWTDVPVVRERKPRQQ